MSSNQRCSNSSSFINGWTASTLGPFLGGRDDYSNSISSEGAGPAPTAGPAGGPHVAYVGNLPSNMVQSEVRDIFMGLQIVSITMICDTETDEFSGFCLVEFADADTLSRALKYDGIRLDDGREIRVECGIDVARYFNKPEETPTLVNVQSNSGTSGVTAVTDMDDTQTRRWLLHRIWCNFVNLLLRVYDGNLAASVEDFEYSFTLDPEEYVSAICDSPPRSTTSSDSENSDDSSTLTDEESTLSVSPSLTPVQLNPDSNVKLGHLQMEPAENPSQQQQNLFGEMLHNNQPSPLPREYSTPQTETEQDKYRMEILYPIFSNYAEQEAMKFAKQNGLNHIPAINTISWKKFICMLIDRHVAHVRESKPSEARSTLQYGSATNFDSNYGVQEQQYTAAVADTNGLDYNQRKKLKMTLGETSTYYFPIDCGTDFVPDCGACSNFARSRTSWSPIYHYQHPYDNCHGFGGRPKGDAYDKNVDNFLLQDPCVQDLLSQTNQPPQFFQCLVGKMIVGQPDWNILGQFFK